MKNFFALVLLSLLVACQTAPAQLATEAPAETNTAAPPEVQPTATAQPTRTPDPVADCRLVRIDDYVSLGFPPNPARIPSTGTVRATMLFVDFDDAPATRSPEDVFAIMSPAAEQFYADLSRGKMDFVLDPHFVWLRMSRDSSFYSEAITTGNGHKDWIQEAVDLADADVDFSNTDTVIVMANPDASTIAYGPTFTGDVNLPDQAIFADATFIGNGVTSGHDLLYWGFMWLNHETGHSMGLPDLYPYEPKGDGHSFVGDFSLMGNIGGEAPEYFAFESWSLGWLEDDQIVCQQEDELTTTITAIETPDGVKAVVIPLTTTKALVIESRRALRYDADLTKPGALVYLVSTNISSGYGQIIVYPQEAGIYAPLALGESLTALGVTVTVVDAGEDYDTITVTRP